MRQKNKNNKKRRIRLSVIPIFLLVLIYAFMNSTLIFASSAASSSEASGEGSEIDGLDEITDETEISMPYRSGMVSAGLYHTILLREDGRVYCWGDNSYGQLGIGSTKNEESPTPVPDLVNIVMVSAGAYHSLALSEDGTVYAWGRNTFGQIGDGTSVVALSPVRIDAIPPMKQISAGAFHSLALTIDGQVYAWGNNNDFQVGDVLSENIVDDTGNVLGKRVLTPQPIVETGVKAVSAGGNHSLYLSEAGEVFAWGNNEYGQLGDGSQTSRGLPTAVNGLTSIIKIAAGYSHNLALKEGTYLDGDITETFQSLYVWGSDSDGQLGLGGTFDETRYVDRPTRVDITNDSNENNDRISLIHAGYANSMITVPVIKTQKRYDSIFIWGNNTYGQLGIGASTSQNIPVPLIATSNGWTGSTFLPFQSIAIGGYHTVFLSVKGFVGIAGRADKGQLGNVSTINSDIPIGVAVPDGIAPEWLEDEKAQGTEQDNTILLTWPEAKDNIKVTGYVVSYIDSNNEAMNIELGNVTKYTVMDYYEYADQMITIKAVDSSGNKSLVPLEFIYETSTERTGSISEQNSGPETYGSDSDASMAAESVITEDSLSTPETNPEASNSGEGLSIPSESASSISDPAGEEPVVTPAADNPLVWSASLYGTVTPMEVPWDVDYVYGKGVVLPPKDYSMPITITITVAIVSFILFLGAAAFRKKHKGSMFFKRPRREKSKNRSEDKPLPPADPGQEIVHIGDGIELIQQDGRSDVSVMDQVRSKKKKKDAKKKIPSPQTEKESGPIREDDQDEEEWLAKVKAWQEERMKEEQLMEPQQDAERKEAEPPHE